MAETITLIRPATPECWPTFRERLNPDCDFTYEEFCANIETIAEVARLNDHECVIIDVKAEAYEQMLEDLGLSDASSKGENARALVELKRSGLLSLEATLASAAIAVGFDPDGPRQRQ